MRSEETTTSVSDEDDDMRIIVPNTTFYYDDDEPIHRESRMLAQLLLDEKLIVFTVELPEGYGEGKSIAVGVMCSDIFAWGCCDDEHVTTDELPALYAMHMKDPAWGTTKWCILKRKEMPQAPVLRKMKESGAWDLDESLLQPNEYDARLAERKLAKERPA